MAAKVTMKSTKQEIMDALHEAERALKQKHEIVTTPAEEKKKVEEEATITEAAQDVEANIFSDEINKKYKNLAEAIALMEARLKEQYEVEAALLNLVNVTNAAKELQLQMQRENEELERSLEAREKEQRENHVAALNKLDAEYEEKKASLEAERRREKEEYNYNTKRERKMNNDKYADERAAIEKEMAAARAEAEKLAADTEKRKAEIEEMEKKIADFPEVLKAEHDKGYTEGEKAAGKEYGYKKNMSDKEHEFELRERDNQIARLTTEVNEKAAKIASLEEKLDAAYAQLRELATKTVESNGSIKVIGGNNDNNTKR